MSWFGNFMFAPICEPATRVDVPVGMACTHCEDLFEPGDCGLQIHHGSSGQHPVPDPDRPYPHLFHYPCYVAMVVGGANHQRRTCVCYGGNQPGDPPGLNRREAAHLALKVWKELHPRAVA